MTKNRLSRITTRTGDNGTTGLADGSRVSKGEARIRAIGDVDELNSHIGLLLAQGNTYKILEEELRKIQNDLFDLGAELAVPSSKKITEQYLERLDAAIAYWNEDLPALKEFILPGGSIQSAQCHVCRTVARRAERTLVILSGVEEINPLAQSYLNRLSDLLFVLTRHLNTNDEIYWKPN